MSAFAIAPKTAELTFLNQHSSEGADPCHLSVDQKRKCVLVANYTSGNVAVLPILHDGSLAKAIDVEQHQLDAPRPLERVRSRELHAG